jgi:anaerobic magnesium-protoporphyrin IX monomethyl ester cyclase
MRIALVAQSINEETYIQLAMPIGLCYLASYGREYFKGETLEFSLFDGTVEASAIEADLVGISTMSRYMNQAEQLAREIKKRKNIPILLGGPHITALPHTLPDSFDAAVLDEGEATFLELLEILRDRGSLSSEELEKVQGIAYQREGRVVINEPRPYIAPLDRIPFPQRALWSFKDRMKWIASSRGCPYECSFCGLARSRYRLFPADYVVRELVEMKETFQIQAITFQDDLFVADKKRLREIVGLIKAQELNKELSFMVSLRADLIDEATMELLKEMNVTNIFMGIESASPAVLHYLKNKTVTVPDMQQAIDLCHQYGIQLEGSFILGSPMETAADLKLTFDFIYDNYEAGKLDMIAFYILTPFPGTKVWDYAVSRGLVDDRMDWSRLNLFTLIDFNPERSIYLNEKIPLDEFTERVDIFKKLLFLVNQKGIYRMKKNLFDPMKVKY